MPSSSSSARTSRGGLPDLLEGDAGLRVEVDAQLVGVLEVGRRRYGHTWKPRQPRLTAQTTWARSAATRASAVVPFGVDTIGGGEPVGRARRAPASGRTTCRSAPFGNRCSSTGRPPIAAMSGSRDGEVVVDEVELGVAPLGEEDLAGVADGHGATGHVQLDGVVGRHPATVDATTGTGGTGTFTLPMTAPRPLRATVGAAAAVVAAGLLVACGSSGGGTTATLAPPSGGGDGTTTTAAASAVTTASAGTAPSGTTAAPATAATATAAPATAPTASTTPAPGSPGGSATAAAATTSCKAVVHLGDSTSVGLVSPSFISDPAKRIGAQYARVGATESHLEISGARSIVETLPGQVNAHDTAAT